MPSTLVHLGLAALLAAALLGTAYSRRTVLVVFAVTAIPDLDAFLSLVLMSAHRAALHTLLIPVLAGVVLWIDDRVGTAWVRERYGAAGIRTASVALLAYVVSGIGLDAFTGGANLFYPLYDQFMVIDGKAILSNQRGLVQTFIDLGSKEPAAGTGVGNTSTVHYDSGVDPVAGPEPENVERVFPIVRAGWQLILVIAGTIGLVGRDWDKRT